MSHTAARYVKKLRVAPTGDRLTVQEKAVLWHIADSHNEKEHAAWTSVRTIANDTMLSERRTREIITSLIRKRILWRVFRKDENTGRDMTNLWKFTVIDGEPPVEIRVAEEISRLKGSRIARSQTVAMFSTKRCEMTCETSQETVAASRSEDCNEPHPDGAGDRRVGLRWVAGGT